MRFVETLNIISRKKEQGLSPARKIVSTLFVPLNSDLKLIGGMTLLFARRGSSRDLDHQASALRPACDQIRRLDF
jgi:hypothetical protein